MVSYISQRITVPLGKPCSFSRVPTSHNCFHNDFIYFLIHVGEAFSILYTEHHTVKLILATIVNDQTFVCSKYPMLWSCSSPRISTVHKSKLFFNYFLCRFLLSAISFLILSSWKLKMLKRSVQNNLFTEITCID